jgi:hypothetical protein
MSDRIEFKVGHEYKNMKGTYEVVSIHDDFMTIRWENGEEVSTQIDLQRRIIERLNYEKERKRQEIQAAEKTARARKSGNKFKGFEETDFKNNITKTTWRNRGCLGGHVAKQISSEKFKFNSWAVSRIPEIHWDDVKHREKKGTWLQAKFFARVDESNLYYGLTVERPDAAETKNEWDNFMSWLKDRENERRLNHIAAENDIYIYDSERKCFSDVIRPCDGIWKAGEKDIVSLPEFFDNLSQMFRTEINIAKIVNKEYALSRNENIIEDIALLINTLLPVYQSVTEAD